MHCSYAKFVVDCEQCAMAYRMAEGPRWDDFDEAMETSAAVGPGGHFLGENHTLRNFQRAFFMPELFDNNSFEQWIIDGGRDTATVALERVRRNLAEYERPAFDPAVDEALLDYIRRREAEIPGDVG